MRRLLFIIALATSWCGAEPAPPQVLEQLQQQTLISGQFVQTRQLQGLPRPIKSSGNFIFWRGHGLYWETLLPFYQATTFSTDEVITWLAPEGPAQPPANKDPVQKYVNRILLSVFSADMSTIDKLFSSRWQLDGDSWSLELTPINAAVKKVIDHARLGGGRHLQQLLVASRGGDVSLMEFEQVVAPAQLNTAQCARFNRQGDSPCPEPASAVAE